MPTTHTDVVGSLLRPPELLQAQKQLTAGVITASRFKRDRRSRRRSDRPSRSNKKSALQIVTDGEMRRQSFQSQMTAAVGSSALANTIRRLSLGRTGTDQQGALKKR